MTASTGTRRRGEQLEQALLEAAWEELRAVGYSRLTMEGVAARAGTSKPVLYRRWSTRPQLVLAAMQHKMPFDTEPPDTGSLRGDLIAFIGRAAARFHQMPGEVMPGLVSDVFHDPEMLAVLRRQIAAAATGDLVRPMITQAVRRGELLADRVTDRIARLPFDLLRSESLLRGTVVDDEVVREVVDDIALPLIYHHCGVPNTGESR